MKILSVCEIVCHKMGTSQVKWKKTHIFVNDQCRTKINDSHLWNLLIWLFLYQVLWAMFYCIAQRIHFECVNAQ